MKGLKKSIGILLTALVIISSIVIPTVSVNAKSVTATFLKNNKTYSFNLDKKGKSEEVRFEQTKTVNENDYMTYYKSDLYIKGKKVFSANDTSNVKAVVADTDKSDKQLEVFIIQGSLPDNSQEWSYIDHIYYYKYANGKTKKVQDLYTLVKSKFSYFTDIHAMDKKLLAVDGKGNLTNRVCVRLASYKDGNGMDFIHFNNNVKLEKGKFVNTKTKSYKPVTDHYMTNKHFSKGTNKVFKKPGSKKVAFTLKNKAEFKISAYYRKSKTSVYIKIKNKQGKTGYINPKTFNELQSASYHVGC